MSRDPAGPRNVAALVQEAGRRFGDAPCLLAYGGDERERSFADVVDFSRGLAAYLDELGVPEGERVAVCFHNSQLAALLFLATPAAGRVLVPINPRSGPLECQHILSRARPRLLLVERGHAGRFAGAAGVAPVEVEDPAALIEEAIGRRDAAGLAAPRPADDAEIVFTSGSTGLPKGVVLSHRALLSNSRAIARLLELDASDRLLTVCPLFHNSGQIPTTLAALWSGPSNLVARSDFAMLKLWHLVESARPTWTLVMNAFLNLTLQRDTAPASCSLKGILSGGSRLGADVIRAFESRFGTRVLQCYGLTETTSIAACERPDARERSVGSAGRAVDSCEIRIDATQPGGVGEIRIRGSNLLTRYLEQPELTRQKLRDGWLHTGDLGAIDDAGMLHVVDRADDMIIVGGENVYPAEIETLTPQLEGVEEAIVVEVPHGILGAELVLVYRPRPGLQVRPERWNEVFLKRLSQFKIPRRRLSTDAIGLDDFPRAQNGKILRREVREKVLGALSDARWQ